MPEEEIARRFEAAAAIAREAGALAKRRFLARDAGTFELKGAQDYLTEADGEVEALVKRRIAERFPGDTVFGEEGGGLFSDACWVVDPIDGTANFARGLPAFCVSIAFVREGRIETGAIMKPMAGELFVARRGGGAFLNGKPIRVSGVTALERATLELGWSLRRPIADYVALIGRAMGAGAAFNRCGSGALGLANVAAGRLDGYAELHINSWDCLAGILLIEEAGGWVSDFLANDGLRHGNAILACTPALRAALIRVTGIGG
jgi:myo-inositol-1(or 4)-monophosphatase